ncbi:MAG: lipopolysaccharide biosynthesis protein [Anaerolineae bacterium]|jgi:O-antigen/teichoic acid export membrane protein|nr:lipopolysaccharide biosynthesis protein [Anaerolineae bacterium]MBT7074879.1 lipopolysaccharide biosynthesis protein [Anaerolineae bacterium]
MPSVSRPSKKQAVRGIMWTYASYYSGKIMIFLSTIILARLLSQDDFGVAGYAIVIISTLKVLSNLGVGQALIYHKEEEGAADTAFWLGLAISLILFLITWFAAPLIGSFFDDPRAIPVTRALIFSFPLTSLGYVQDMLLRKKLSFKRKFIPDLSRSLAKGFFSIIFALLGYGAWSLIYGQLIGTALASIAYWIIVPWKPSFNFNPRLARIFLGFGANIVAVNALSVLLDNADYLAVGRYLGAASLGVYTLAFRIPDMLIMQFNALIGKVLFPFYAKIRDDNDGLKRSFLYTTKYISLITFPIGFGIALVSAPLILTVFGEKWVEAIPVMRSLAIYSVIISLVYNAGDVYKAQGRPEILTRLSILEGTLLLPALYFSVRFIGTIAAVGWARVSIAFVLTSLDIIIASRLINASFKEILKALTPALGAASIMAVAVSLTLFSMQDIMPTIQLIMSIAIGGVVYIGGLWLFQRELLLEGYATLRNALVRN